MSDNTSNTTAGKICDKIRTFLELDSRGIGQRSNAADSANVEVRYIEIPTPAWYPDSLLRSMKRNNYMSMINNAASKNSATTIKGANDNKSLDFYQEDDSDMITGLVKNVVKSVVSYGANQLISITSKVDSLVSGLNSLASSFGGKNATTSTEINMESYPFLSNQPYVTIYGIHMTESLRDKILTFQSVIGSLSAQFTKATYGALMSKDSSKTWIEKCKGAITGIAKDFAEKAKTALIKFISGDSSLASSDWSTIAEKLANDEKIRLHGVSETLLNCIASGTYTMKCKVPFIYGNSQSVLNSSGESGFLGQGNLRAGDSTGIGEFIKSQSGLNAVWTNPLDWNTATLSQKTVTPLILNFDIVNDTLEHTMLNLAFIWLFGATSKAVTDSFFVRPPFLYDIQIPTGFRFKYCTCNFTVEPRGKVRKLGDSTDENSPIVNLFKNVYGLNNINPKAIEYVPDFYNVRMTFTSLLPDLWNFMDSYLFISNTDADTDGNEKIEIGKRLSTKMQTLIDNIK